MNSQSKQNSVALFAWLLLLVANNTTWAQDNRDASETPENTPVVASITAEQIEARIQRVTDLVDEPEDVKSKIVELYNQSLDQLKRANTHQATAEKYRVLIESVDRRLEEIHNKISALKAEAPADPKPGPLPEMEKELAKKSLALKKLKDSLATIEADELQRAARRKAIPARQVKVQEDLNETIGKTAVERGDESSELERARVAELETHRQMLETELPAIANELALYQAEELVGLQRAYADQITAQIKVTEAEFELAQSVVQRKRLSVAENKIDDASAALKKVDPKLLPLAQRNQELAETNRTLTTSIDDLDWQIKQDKATLAKLQLNYNEIIEKVDAVGLNSAIGKDLRQQRMRLESPGHYRARVAELQQLIDAAHLEIIDLKSERSENPEPAVWQALREANVKRTDKNYESLLEEGIRLVESKNEFLDPLITNQNKYFDKLVDQSTTLERTIRLIETYEQFIDERVLWIRSGKPLVRENGLEAANFWFADRTLWVDALKRLNLDVRQNHLFWICIVAILCGWLFFRPRVHKRISDIGTQVRRGSFAHFLPTLRALALTFLAALPFPILFAFLGWRFWAIAAGQPLLLGLSAACWNVAAGLLVLKFVRQTCRERGLAESHFQWEPDTVSSLRKHIPILTLVALPLVFLNTSLDIGSKSIGSNLLPRICFIAVMIVIAIFTFRLLHPKRGVFKTYLALNREGWMSRLRHVWFWPAVAAPILLAALAYTGYYYTAQQLSVRLFTTGCMLVAIAVVFAFFERMLLVNRRRLSIEEARLRRAALEAETRADGEPAPVPQELAVEEDPLEELRAQTAQSQRLLKTVMVGVAIAGTWFAWADVVPALGFFDRWPLWTNTVEVTEAVTNAVGKIETRTVEEQQPVTIVHLIIATVIMIVTFVSSRNIPGALEIGVLRSLPLDHSVRYAITTLVSYAILLIGVFIACSTIGLRWNQIQWMATALTFGLAFGLQEMFANFVAGIIILFERPIRVGDLVTIDDTTGVVKRIRIRATTITSLERKDYVVPNKEFITGRLLNWTLSDPIIRLEIDVGVAYGSKTELAHELLLKIAAEHKEVLDEPAPTVIFNLFGDNCLNFALRVFVTTAEKRFEIVNDLHMAIDREFRKANIEIAFPQRDLYLRGIPEEVSEFLAHRGEQQT